MTGRYVDEDGHSWPITGRWCAQCGLPLHDATPGDTHPWEATP